MCLPEKENTRWGSFWSSLFQWPRESHLSGPCPTYLLLPPNTTSFSLHTLLWYPSFWQSVSRSFLKSSILSYTHVSAASCVVRSYQYSALLARDYVLSVITYNRFVGYTKGPRVLLSSFSKWKTVFGHLKIGSMYLRETDLRTIVEQIRLTNPNDTRWFEFIWVVLMTRIVAQSHTDMRCTLTENSTFPERSATNTLALRELSGMLHISWRFCTSTWRSEFLHKYLTFWVSAQIPDVY